MNGLDLLYCLRLDDGRPWGEAAVPFQREDAHAIFSQAKPHLHYLTRPRGASKTSDLAAVALSWLAADAPARSRAYVVASNSDQAALLIDAASGFVARTPELAGYLTIEAERVLASNGASVRVLPASDSGSWGLLNCRLIVCDEFAQWPATRGSRRVWSAIRSTVQKVPGCRLVVLTSAGEPSHWSYEVLRLARRDPESWRVHEVPGPVPWQDPADIEALRRELVPSECERLVLNEWAEAEDRAVSPEDYEIAAMPAQRDGMAPTGVRGGGWRLRPPAPAQAYIVTVDVGLQADSTVMAVCHREAVADAPGAATRLVCDHLERWTGSRRHHVQLSDVEARIATLASEYNGATVHADPTQFQGSLQALNRRGLRAQEFVFSSTSVGQVASALVHAFHGHRVLVPDFTELRTELLAVKLRETAPGVTRLDHSRAGHDDMAVCLGMAAHLLLAGQRWGPGAAFVSMMKAQIAERSEEGAKNATERRTERELANMQRAVRLAMSGPAHRPRERRAACEHRWRAGGNDCMFCGSLRDRPA